MKIIALASVLCLALGVAGCGETTTSRTLSGGAMGAAGGTVVGAAAGNTLAGTAIGAGAGLAGGYIYDQHKKGNID